MSVSRSIVGVLLVVGGAVAGCGAAQEVSDAANSANQAATKASLCLEAIQLASFTPDLSQPEQAVAETQQKADELGKLAERAGDTTLRQAIEGVSTTMGEVTLNDLGGSAATWLQKKADQVAKLTAACG